VQNTNTNIVDAVNRASLLVRSAALPRTKAWQENVASAT
jgi:hypothetical protein